MGKKGITFAILFFITLITTGVGFYFFHQKNQEAIAQQSKIDQLSEEVRTYKKKVAEAEDQVKKFENEKNRLESRMQIQSTRDTSIESGYKKQGEIEKVGTSSPEPEATIYVSARKNPNTQR